MVSSRHRSLCIPLLTLALETVETNTPSDLPDGSGDLWENAIWAVPEVLEAITRQNEPDVNNNGIHPPSAPSSQLGNFPCLPGSTVQLNHSNTDEFVAPPSISTPNLHQLASFHAPAPEMVATELTNVQPPASHTLAVTFHAPNPIPMHNDVQFPPGLTQPALHTPVLDPTAPSHFSASKSAAAAANSLTLLPYLTAVAPQSQAPASGSVASAAPATLHANVPAKSMLGTTPAALPITAPLNPLPLAQKFDISTPLPPVPQWAPVNPTQSRNSKDKKRESTKENVAPPSNNSPGNGPPAGGLNRPRPTGAPLQDLPVNGAPVGGQNEVMPTLLPPPLDASTNRTLPTPTPPSTENYTIRRSTRAPIPSTRLERQNEIGTNIIPPRPPVDVTSVVEEPAWFAPAYDHLKNNALGTIWTDLVEKWAEYERAKGWTFVKVCPFFFL